MERYKLRKISFGSYIKLIALSSFGTGLLFGLLGLVIALCGGTVTWNGQVVDYGIGILVGLFILVIFPLAWGGILTIFSMLAYPMLCLGIKLIKGIKIKAVIEPCDISTMEIAFEKAEEQEVTEDNDNN